MLEERLSVECPKMTMSECHEMTKKTSKAQSNVIRYRLFGNESWEAMIRKFSQVKNQTPTKRCNLLLPEEFKITVRDKKHFPTGSSYEGSWNIHGMSGHGTYKFPKSDVTYVGEFYDGMFHGAGEMHYEGGAILRGKWFNGQLVEQTLVFEDGLEHSANDWVYSRPADRRYTVEIDNEIEPAGRSHLTAHDPPPKLEPGFYDVGDGMYDPTTKTIYEYGDRKSILRAVTDIEDKWIVNNCRTNPDPYVGPCSFLYEKWVLPPLTLPKLPPPAQTAHNRQAGHKDSKVSVHVADIHKNFMESKLHRNVYPAKPTSEKKPELEKIID